jgi:hypothetical protein
LKQLVAGAVVVVVVVAAVAAGVAGSACALLLRLNSLHPLSFSSASSNPIPSNSGIAPQDVKI